MGLHRAVGRGNPIPALTSFYTLSCKTSILQFGLKQNMSTTHCTYLMMETIIHYNANGSNVYALMLDTSKAFDRVNYCKLFRVLLKRQVSTLVLRLLLYMYMYTKAVEHTGLWTPELVCWTLSERQEETGEECLCGRQDYWLISPFLEQLYMERQYTQPEYVYVCIPACCNTSLFVHSSLTPSYIIHPPISCSPT